MKEMERQDLHPESVTAKVVLSIEPENIPSTMNQAYRTVASVLSRHNSTLLLVLTGDVPPQQLSAKRSRSQESLLPHSGFAFTLRYNDDGTFVAVDGDLNPFRLSNVLNAAERYGLHSLFISTNRKDAARLLNKGEPKPPKPEGGKRTIDATTFTFHDKTLGSMKTEELEAAFREANLTEKERIVVRLSLVYTPYKDIVALTKIPKGSIYYFLERAKEKLRKTSI